MSADGPRDWDKELADIDKLIAAGPPKAGPAPVRGSAAGSAAPAPTARAAGAVAPRATRREAVAVWVRVGLAAALGAAMTQWPYARDCGGALFLYAGAIGVVLVAGLWAALGAWRRRMGGAHTLALLTLAWGGVLAAAVVLPRIGYAQRVATWWCP